MAWDMLLGAPWGTWELCPKPSGTPQIPPDRTLPPDQQRILGPPEPPGGRSSQNQRRLWAALPVPLGPHLVLLLQAPQGTQALATVPGGHQEQLLLYPGHLLVCIPEELQQQAPGLQGCPALLQGRPQALEPAAVEGGPAAGGTPVVRIRGQTVTCTSLTRSVSLAMGWAGPEKLGWGTGRRGGCYL